MPISQDLLGANLNAIYGATEKLPLKLGTLVRGDDARMYVLAKATADVAANTASILTEPAMTFAGGAGAWTTQGTAITNGQVAWLKSSAI
jgi:hypothetical protein